MRQVYQLTGIVVLVAVFTAALFALYQVNQEQLELTSRMQSRNQVIADSLREAIEPWYNKSDKSAMQRIIDRFVSKERLAGITVFDNAGNVVAGSADMPLPENAEELIPTVMDSDEDAGDFVAEEDGSFYVHIVPLHNEESIVGALAVAQNATYIELRLREIWRDNLLRLLFQVLFIVAVAVVLVRWVFFRSISRMVQALQAARRDDSAIATDGDGGFFEPLAGELSKVTRSLRQARHSASEEARLRLEKLDTPWTAERLREFIKASFPDRPIFVLTNREPYVHRKVKSKIEWAVPAGGVVTALEPVMEACGGMWIAHGHGSADRETADRDGKLMVPPDEPRYTLKRIWLTEQEIAGYYTGLSNEALWPLCLMAHTRPLFREGDWQEYKSVNARFAETLLSEIRNVERPIVLVQDYHLALVPQLIKHRRPDAQVALFWHIPWPSALQFNICPWRKEMLLGVLGADLIGFHTQQYCNNFIDTVGNEIESRIDYGEFCIMRGNHQTQIKAFPISIAFPGRAEAQGEPERSILSNLGIKTAQLVLGVDRLDYTKGILERFKGFEFLLQTHPTYRERVTLLQIASPTRETVEKYREYALKVAEEAERINAAWGTRDWKPIVLERRNYAHEELNQLYQLANVCLITSLHDGMNLVAKEFAAARRDESGVLVLSQFTGAARDLKGACLVNPYSAEETSAALHDALTMPLAEQQRRMRLMRASVRDYNIYRWSAELIKALSQVE